MRHAHPRWIGDREAATLPVVIEPRFLYARAYRQGQLVCERAQVAVVSDRRVGLAPAERRYITVRFLDGIEDRLRGELARLVGLRGMRGSRFAEMLAPIDLVVEDREGEHRIVGRVQPPVMRCGSLREIDFRVREHAHQLERSSFRR
jgi:hypothetical protein